MAGAKQAGEGESRIAARNEGETGYGFLGILRNEAEAVLGPP